MNAIMTLHSFISIRKFNEVDTSFILERIWQEFPRIRTAAPRIDPVSLEMDSFVFPEDGELVENEWGIPEPVGSESVEPSETDLVLVPGLAFDRNGHRVGYGKGFYDRFLGKCRADCLKIGLSFFEPVDYIGDVHDGYVRLDFCITPERVFETR